MKRLCKLRTILPLVLAWLLSFSLAATALAGGPQERERGGGGPDASSSQSSTGIIIELRDGGSIEEVNARHGTKAFKRTSGTSTYLLAPPANGSIQQVVDDLKKDRNVLFAEPDHSFKSLEAQQFSLAFDGQYSFAVENDAAQAMYRGQWAVYWTRLPEAQAIATGRGVTVAILDTGVALSHPALQDKFTAARYDFLDNDEDPSDLPNGIDGDGDGKVDEAAGHGTFIAGIVALVAPEASIIPLRVLDSEGWGTVYNVSRAIHYAVDHGANVINVSLGMNHNSRVLEEAVNYAHDRNVVLVASVGNRLPQDRTGNILYPARYEAAVAVAATDSDDVKTSFSNWGRETDISAPGAAIYSTYGNGGYAWWSGTSMAAAFVSGGAALVRGQHPGWSEEQIVRRLTGTATNIDRLNFGQYRGKLGSGRIDFYAAVR